MNGDTRLEEALELRDRLLEYDKTRYGIRLTENVSDFIIIFIFIIVITNN